MNAREQRRHVFRCVFQLEFFDIEQLDEQIDNYMFCIGIQDKDSLISEKVHNIASRLDEIDHRLDSVSERWKVSRMSKVDLAVLRLAVYELFWDDNIPDKVAINEAIEIVKRYGTDESSAFVNGVLGSFINKQAKSDPGLEHTPAPPKRDVKVLPSGKITSGHLNMSGSPDKLNGCINTKKQS